MIIRIDMIGTMDVYASHRIEVPADEISAEAILGAAEMAIQNHEVAWEHEGVEVNRIAYSEDDIRVWDTEFGDWVSLEDWLANHGGGGRMKTVQEIDRIIVTALVEDIVTAGYAINIIADGDSVITRSVDRAIEYILDLEECTVNPVKLKDVVVDGKPSLAVEFSPGGILLTPGEEGWDIICNYTSNEAIEKIIARAEQIANQFMLQSEEEWEDEEN